jgi:predicted nuclease of predicted toxin-antitoxin system
MKLKLDECLDVRLAKIFNDAGFHADTVSEEKLSGTTDRILFSHCLREGLIFVTQDMDFSNPLRFSPLESQGIIVLRNPSQLLREAERLVRSLVKRLAKEHPRGHLWVVDRNRIRIWPSD